MVERYTFRSTFSCGWDGTAAYVSIASCVDFEALSVEQNSSMAHVSHVSVVDKCSFFFHFVFCVLEKTIFL